MPLTKLSKSAANFWQSHRGSALDVSATGGKNMPSVPCHHNKTLLQGFEWYCPSDGQHWHRLATSLERFKSLGITCIWLPPACKAGWQGSNGYDVYDLYDLGEFDQKDSVRTKWGDKDALVKLAELARHHGIGLYFDAVLNHKCAADYTEQCQAVVVSQKGVCS
jgi:alpha-amylase